LTKSKYKTEFLLEISIIKCFLVRSHWNKRYQKDRIIGKEPVDESAEKKRVWAYS
tara:strand:- start:1 stop:165 length:165 start_codon:yes stop_codon:yes gene_type:complete